MSTASKWFWNERFWLPGNTTWADLHDTEDAKFAQASHLYMVIPYSLVLYAVRIFMERCIARPIGIRLQISDAPSKPPECNPILEKVFDAMTTRPQNERLRGLCKQLDWSERQVLSWFRRRRNVSAPSKLSKFQETFWRFSLYSFLFAFGIVTLRHSSPDCLFDTSACWRGYPDRQQLNAFNYWYFQIELAFYASCAVSQFVDVRRRDFWAMCIHHFATILLIGFSYAINMLNIGAVIMVLHDFSDVSMEGSKLAKYAKFETAATVGLIGFSACFGITRLIYYPFWVLRSVYLDCPRMVGPFPSWYLFCVWLALLQCLNVYWYTFVVKGFVLFLREGGPADDARSESEASDSAPKVTSGELQQAVPDPTMAVSPSRSAQDTSAAGTTTATNATLRKSASQHTK